MRFFPILSLNSPKVEKFPDKEPKYGEFSDRPLPLDADWPVHAATFAAMLCSTAARGVVVAATRYPQ
jgi:hypothetical protein